jgi:hypothetical protein
VTRKHSPSTGKKEIISIELTASHRSMTTTSETPPSKSPRDALSSSSRATTPRKDVVIFKDGKEKESSGRTEKEHKHDGLKESKHGRKDKVRVLHFTFERERERSTSFFLLLTC